MLALINDSDRDHGRCVELLARSPEPPLLPVAILTGICQILERRGAVRAETAFLSDVVAGLFDIVDSPLADLERVITLLETYAAIHLGVVAASVIAAAERLDVTTVATLDPGRLAGVRPRHTPAFTLLP